MTRAPEPKKAEKTVREQRLAAALRENLRRRKAQTRGRTPEKPMEPGPEKADNR